MHYASGVARWRKVGGGGTHLFYIEKSKKKKKIRRGIECDNVNINKSI